MSGVSAPTPAQNRLIPLPVPVDSNMGEDWAPLMLNCSATALAKGNTVEEPTIRISLRVPP